MGSLEENFRIFWISDKLEEQKNRGLFEPMNKFDTIYNFVDPTFMFTEAINVSFTLVM